MGAQLRLLDHMKFPDGLFIAQLTGQSPQIADHFIGLNCDQRVLVCNMHGQVPFWNFDELTPHPAESVESHEKAAGHFDAWRLRRVWKLFHPKASAEWTASQYI